MITACGYVLAMQFLEIPAVVANDYHAAVGCKSQLLRVRPTQLARISRSYRPITPMRKQLANENIYVLVKIYRDEQFAVQRCLTLGWMSSGGILFFLMYSFISSRWSQ